MYDSLNIIWLGGVFNQTAIERSHAIAPAANLWQRKVIGALRANGHTVRNLAHCPDRVFPYGQLLPGRPSDFSDEFPGTLVPYLNLPVLRTASLIPAFRRAFKRLLKEQGHPDCLLGYNPTPWNAALGRWVQKVFGIPWINLNLDFCDPGPEWRTFIEAAGGACGQVFLSWYAYQNCPIGPKYHFDALANYSERRWALTEDRISTNGGSKSIVYAGAFHQWGGVVDLVDAFVTLNPPGVWLDLCGHTLGNTGEKLAQQHPRIRFHGLVSEEKLEALCAGASLLVNPRPSGVIGSEMNFPSKLMEYLSYGLPVVSTWTPGLAPCYKDLMIECEDGVKGIAEGLNRGLSLSHNSRDCLRQRIKKFLTEERDPPLMIKNLMDWVEMLIKSRRIS